MKDYHSNNNSAHTRNHTTNNGAQKKENLPSKIAAQIVRCNTDASFGWLRGNSSSMYCHKRHPRVGTMAVVVLLFSCTSIGPNQKIH